MAANRPTACQPADCAPLTAALDLASWPESLAASAGSSPAACSADSWVAVCW